MNRFIFIIFGILLMCSCMTDKKLQGYAEKYYLLHPDQLAHVCADKYPAKVTLGSIIRKIDTLTLPGSVLPCPERVDSTGAVRRDSVKCPGNKIIHDSTLVHDTLIDMALVSSLRFDTAVIGKAYRTQMEVLNTTIGEKNKAQEQAKKRLLYNIGLGLLSTLLLAALVKFVIL